MAVMKSADLRDRNDSPASWSLHIASMGTVVVEGLMRAGGVVVTQGTCAADAEMPFVDHDDVIEAFASNRSDDALGERILPGRSRRDEDLAHPEAFHPSYEPRRRWHPGRGAGTWARSRPGSSRPVGERTRRRWGGRWS